MVMQCEQIINNIKKYPIDKLVFWVGAGIDRDSPTQLPLGYELTDDILERACGKDLSNSILQEWKNSKNFINKIMNENIHVDDYPRLETILEAVRIFEDNLSTDNTIINGLKSFADAPPNNNHYVLAEMLHRGANIVTTNYDRCVPIAYNELFKNDDDKLLLCSEDNVWIYKSKNKYAGAIYHLHGIAQCIDNIGATLSVVKNPIARIFDRKMSEWLNEGCCFIFLGYGGVDTLDITPYLKNKNGFGNSLGIYVRHSNDNNVVEHANVKENDLLQCFTEKYVLSYNTKEFLKIYSSKEFKIMKNPNNNWKEKFSELSIKYNCELQHICALGIIYFLNLNPCKVLGEQWINEYRNLRNVNISNWYIGNYGFRNALRCGKIKESNYFAELMENSELLKSDIHATKNLFMSYILDRNYWKKTKFKVCEALSNKDVIDWNISTPLNREIQFMLYLFALCPLKCNFLVNILKKRGLELIKIIHDLIAAGPIYFLEINQLNVAYIDLAILEMIFNQNYVKAWQNIYKARYNYVEISSISGIINTFFYEIIYYEIKYMYDGKEEYKENAKNLYNKVNLVLKNEEYYFKYEKLLKLVEILAKKTGTQLHN